MSRRKGVTDTLAAGKPWIEIFTSRGEANRFMQSVASGNKSRGFKARSKTYVSVDPDTDTAVFIVETRKDERPQ